MAPERTNVTNGSQLRNASNLLTSNSQTLNRPNAHPGVPPPLPPRQPAQSYSGYNDYRPLGYGGYSGYGGYGSPYRGYGGYGSYNSYTPYSGMSAYGNYGPAGHGGDVESRFLQYAEESTRSTFRVVETVLHTFSSMTMLLESTYFAMTNSFRAILSVADNLGRLRSTIGQLASTFALVRFLKWIYRRLTRLAGMRNPGSLDEELWERSLARVGGENPTVPSSWPGILMFGTFVLIPYVIHKIASTAKNIGSGKTEPRDWQQSEEPVYVASVLYDFVAANNDELSVRAGQKIILAPQSAQPKNLPGWRLATDKMNVGLVPYNYVAVVGRLQKREKSEADVTEAGSSAEEKTNGSRNGPEDFGATVEENVVKESS